MAPEYFVFYVQANTVCVLVLLILLVNDKLHSTNQEKQIWFNRTIFTHILYFVSDMFWAAVLSGQLVRSRLLVGFFNFSNYILLSLLSFEWFMYMAAAENLSLRNTRRKKSCAFSR